MTTAMSAIARRELAGFFFSPVAYVSAGLFLLVSGLLFYSDFRPGEAAAMRTLFEWMVWVLVLIVPVLCMGLLSQEWSSGTMETLMTAPVKDEELVLGKFLAAAAFVVLMLLPTVLYVAALAAVGRPDVGPIVSGYVGALLVGWLFVAVSLLCSSLTRSQIVAAVGALGVLFVITILPWWLGTQTLLPGWVRGVIDQLVFARYTDFSKGLIDVGHVVFFLLSTAVLLFATVKVVESRRWR